MAEGDDGVVAFVLGARRGRREGHVITLDVAPEARRHGVGRHLLARLEERFHAQGVRRVRLEVAVDNAVAIAFYERQSYETVGRIADYYGPGLDAWEMEKALAVE